MVVMATQERSPRSPPPGETSSRRTSTSRPMSRQGPINEAVSDAFQDANAANTISPEMLDRITQSVIQKLGLENLTPTAPHQSQFPAAPPLAAPNRDSHPPLSPSTTHSGTSPTLQNRVMTPPSPHRQPDYLGPASPSLPPPSRATEPPMSPNRNPRQATLSPNRSSSPVSQVSDDSNDYVGQASRPRGPVRLHTGLEMTTLEKIWGALFNEQGKATLRLGQFLRGLATHIIEDFEPRNSLVVTPHKMVNYYKTVTLENEIYPWDVIFDDEVSSISRLYRALACEHHLVQEFHNERPDIPGLTPRGFEKFTTLLILANPDVEYERLTKALLHMPIDNPDNKKERFPKEVTRRLFPAHEDLDTRYRVEDAMIEHASIEIPRPRQGAQDNAKARRASPSGRTSPDHLQQRSRPSVSFAEPDEPTGSNPPALPNERERAPYSNVPEAAVVDDTNPPDSPAVKPIERERKPYVSQVGKYEPEEVRPRDSARPRADSTAINKPARSDSATAHSRPIPINPNIQQMPKPEIHQSYHNGNAASNTHRRRSPSFSQGSDYRRPELDVHNSYRSTFEPGSVPRNTSTAPSVIDETDTKRYFENQARDRVRKKADEDARAYGESPRRHGSLKPKRTDYANEDDYWRAREKRDRSYDDENRYREPHGSYR